MIPAVVLAAGKSSRMGRTKALLPIGSPAETFLNRIIRVLREGGMERVVVVIGGASAGDHDHARPALRAIRRAERPAASGSGADSAA